MNEKPRSKVLAGDFGRAEHTDGTCGLSAAGTACQPSAEPPEPHGLIRTSAPMKGGVVLADDIFEYMTSRVGSTVGARTT